MSGNQTSLPPKMSEFRKLRSKRGGSDRLSQVLNRFGASRRLAIALEDAAGTGVGSTGSGGGPLIPPKNYSAGTVHKAGGMLV